MTERTFPADDVLIARGKYATLRKKHRDNMKRLQEHMVAVTDQARSLVRFDDDAEVAMSFYMAMQGHVTDTGVILQELTDLQAELIALKSLAWGKT